MAGPISTCLKTSQSSTSGLALSPPPLITITIDLTVPSPLLKYALLLLEKLDLAPIFVVQHKHDTSKRFETL